MGSADIVIFKDVFVQNIVQMFFVENYHMVKTFSAKRTNDSFTNRILPWTSRGGWCVFQTESFYILFEIFAEDFVIISDNLFGGFFEV